MPDVAPTRSVALELAEERRLMRQGYEFLDEKRMLLATEMLRQSRIYEERADRLNAEMKAAAAALAAAVVRHGLDELQVCPKSERPTIEGNERSLFLGLPMLSPLRPTERLSAEPKAINPSPEAKACRAAFERLLWTAADVGVQVGNLNRLAREYRRTERRAKALEKVLLPEVEEAAKYVDDQLDSIEREEITRTGRLARRKLGAI